MITTKQASNSSTDQGGGKRAGGRGPGRHRAAAFGNAFKDACRAAGLFNRSAHGCRKIAATRAAEAGATVAELNAIFGWKGTSMASLYTEAADRKRLALGSMAKLQGKANETATSMPTPMAAVWASGRKGE